MMRQYRVNQYLVETPEEVQALFEIKRAGNHSMLMLSRVWRAERTRRETSRRPYAGPIFRITVEFNTETRKCTVIKWNRIPETIGVLPYNEALRYCRENLKLKEPEVAQ